MSNKRKCQPVLRPKVKIVFIIAS